MELLESQSPEKKKLIETSERHKRALEKEVSELSQKTDKMLTNALIIGASLAATYFVVSTLAGGARKKKKRRKKIIQVVKAPKENVDDDTEEAEEADFSPSLLGMVGSRVMTQASVILLNLAKDKLFEYLESRKKGNENS
ncbi:hypothetical protein BH09BAC3_BH09BAC3_28290 [soil metagenome]